MGLECQQTSCTLGPCQQKACANGGKTTVHGTVYDPAGKVPLYNVVVYVPKGDVPPLASGATCDRCDGNSVSAVASALTDTHGNFVLNDVPVGNNIPLIMKVGKWRRQIKIPTVTACSDLALTDVNQTRLPPSSQRVTSRSSPSPPGGPTRWSVSPGAWGSTTRSSRPTAAKGEFTFTLGARSPRWAAAWGERRRRRGRHVLHFDQGLRCDLEWRRDADTRDHRLGRRLSPQEVRFGDPRAKGR